MKDKKNKKQISHEDSESSSSDLMDKNNCNMETYEGNLRTVEPEDYN